MSAISRYIHCWKSLICLTATAKNLKKLNGDIELPNLKSTWISTDSTKGMSSLNYCRVMPCLDEIVSSCICLLVQTDEQNKTVNVEQTLSDVGEAMSQ